MRIWKDRLITLLLLCVAAFSMSTLASAVNAQQLYMNMPIDKIIDGDTIKTHLSPRRLPPPLNSLSIRIYGIDTPEMPAKSYSVTGKLGRAKCDKEAKLAIEARNALIDMVGVNKRMRVARFTWGTYGSRIVADVYIGGVNVANHLIAMGLAVPYIPGMDRKNWCQSN